MKTLSSVTKDLKINSRACLTGLLLSFAALPAMAGTIVGSAHDFTDTVGWVNANGEMCNACHTPHNAGAITDAPLWNHTVTSKSFTMYTSTTLDSAVSADGPTGSSKLCLSCHDGTVALDSFGGSTSATQTSLSGDKAIGSDELTNDHPISFTYDDQLVLDDGALHATSTAVTIGSGSDTKAGTIATMLLIGGQVQCASCHDVHNKFTDGGSLLRVSNAGSALCLTCHNK